MSQGFRAYERPPARLQPLIPTPFPLPPLSPCHTLSALENKTTLNHYYETYVRMVRENNILHNQLKIINEEKQELSQRFENMKSEQQRKKRHRRTADEIKRNHQCPIRSCGRSYGSDGSLLQHIKLKHYQFYQSEEYEKLLLAKQRKRAEASNQQSAST